MEYAEVQITNAASTPCRLAGFPDLALVAGGTLVGQRASHSGSSGVAITLAPHAKATAKITDASSCNAPLSDSARITLPEASAYVEAPIVLRACALTVTAFSPA